MAAICASIASITLPAQPRTCHLADDDDRESHPYSFRKLTSADLPRSRQALADVTRIALRVGGGQRKVILRAIPLGPSLPIRQVTLEADAHDEVKIHLVNLPSHSYHRSRVPLCKAGVTDTHFEVYFQLLRDAPDVDDRRAAVEITETTFRVQPQCRNFSICDVFFTDFRHVEQSPQNADMCFLSPRIPPACPPVVF